MDGIDVHNGGACQVSDILQAVANLDAWLDTMRGENGYTGPVVHWWRNSLSYAGVGLDWRYEGIICGYLTLFERTGNQKWLEKACRAGDDLVAGQTTDGHFAYSRFEQNPGTGGTPHEAAADLGLLRLAICLRGLGNARWERFADSAEKNLQSYFIDHLWDVDAQSFRDTAAIMSFVPNKACTLVEALFAWAELRGDERVIVKYALPTLQTVVKLQRADGAIPQNWLGETLVKSYFPYYIARCIPALRLAYQFDGGAVWLDSAENAANFIKNQFQNSCLPQVVYEQGRNQYPEWIAPLGDILRIVTMPKKMTTQLLNRQTATGAFPTAQGFAAQVSQRWRSDVPSFRDVLPVVGWCDKVLRFLAELVPRGATLPAGEVGVARCEVVVNGQRAVWREDMTAFQLTRQDGRTLYQWQKGADWATVVSPEVMWA